MKRFVLLSICLLLLGATMANAAAVPVTGVTTVGDVHVNGTYDAATGVVDIYLSSLTGSHSAQTITGLEGAWTATGGTFYVVNKAATATTFKQDTSQSGLDALPGAGGPFSGINFDSYVSGYNKWGRDGGTTFASSLINGSWNQGGNGLNNVVPNATAYQAGPQGGTTNGDGWNSSLIGQFIVTPGTTQIDFGTFTPATNQFSYSLGTGPTSASVGFHVLLVPEPSTLALLGCGLFGLLAYAWRKRK
jgi:hypothetical protein